MQKFNILTGIAAPLNLQNIDTDMLIPKQFLKTIKREGLGKNLFDEMRFTSEGKEIPEFILNQSGFRESKILLSGDNFGCGSSREHAPWALSDFGIRCIIAPSFADIFFNNCFKNGMLPIVLSQEIVDELIASLEGKALEMTINLETEMITDAKGKQISFPVDAFRKNCLLNGLDDIGLTLQKADKINSFEAEWNLKSWS